MKAFFKTCLVLAMLLVLSCNDDSVTPQKLPDPSIVGLWNGIDISFSGASLNLYQDPDHAVSLISVGYDEDFSFNIQEDPNQLVIEGTFGVLCTLSDSEYSEDYMIPGNTMGGQSLWSKSGDLFITEFLGEVTVFTIDVLTEANLVISAIVPFEQLMIPMELQGDVLLTLEFERM
jgi:hypothetical protein